MLQQSPEYRKRLAESAHAEEKAIRHEHKRMARLQRTAGAATLALFAAVHLAGYEADVHANQEIQANAHISISEHGAALDPKNNHKALIFVDGFRSYDSINLMTYMHKATQPVFDGQLWSVDYNNAFLNAKQTATEIEALAKKRHVDTLTFVDYSAGGAFGMNVESYLVDNPNLTVQANVLESVPNGAGGLRLARQDEVGLVEKIKHIPDVQYSTPARFIGEMAFRAASYNAPLDSSNPLENIRTAASNTLHFFQTAHDVQATLADNKTPGTWLMFDQVLAIENANFKEHIDELNKLPSTKPRPVTIYVGTGTPGYDYMVNNQKSAQEIGSYAAAAGVPFLQFDVPNAVHSRPDLANKEYIHAFADAKPAIQAAIAREAAVARINQTLMDAQQAMKTQQNVQTIYNLQNVQAAEPTPLQTPAP